MLPNDINQYQVFNKHTYLPYKEQLDLLLNKFSKSNDKLSINYSPDRIKFDSLDDITLIVYKDNIVSFGVPEIDGGLGASSQFLRCKKQIQTTMRRLDDIIEEQNITKVDFIKADIEGGELDMLRGAEKLLEKFKPIIMIEIVDVHCHRFGYLSADVYQFLLSKGYSGLFIDNQYTKKKTNIEIDKLTKPNINNLLNGNYLFSSM